MTTVPSKRSWLRRLFRFSLVTFLIAIGILAGVFGWLRYRAEQQRLAVEWITSRGGEIRYTHYRQLKTNVYYSLGSDEGKAQRAALRPDNSWLADTLGEEYVHRVESLHFYQSKLDGEAWHLAHAFGAKQMSFYDCDVAGKVLEALGNCSSLEELFISDCRLDAASLGHLAKLPKLRMLSLSGSKFGAGALVHIGQCPNLEWLELVTCEFPAEDLRHLHSLSKLTFLGLGFTSVTTTVFSPDGATLWTTKMSPQRALDRWDVRVGEPIAQLAGHAKGINRLECSPNGKLFGRRYGDRLGCRAGRHARADSGLRCLFA